MEPIKLMVVEDNSELRKMIADYFAAKDDVEVIGTAANGMEALEQLDKNMPDVMLLDMIMPRVDGFEMLDRMHRREDGAKPEVIALTALCREDFISRAMEMGASYYMVKPFDFELLYRRVVEVANQRRGEPAPSAALAAGPGKSLEERTATLFLTVGIPAHIKGYQYLREAVLMVAENHDVINRITKELYPGIARKFGTSASKVERAMRHAIEVAWTRGRLDTVNQMYGYKVFQKDDKPTNGEFISCVVEKLSVKKSA